MNLLGLSLGSVGAAAWQGMMMGPDISQTAAAIRTRAGARVPMEAA